MDVEQIIISDTNILIDLFSVDLLDAFFLVPWIVRTTDFVIRELSRKDQSQKIHELVGSGRLQVVEFDGGEVSEIAVLMSACEGKISMADCSVWYEARRTGGRLLTGDGRLRREAQNDGVRVSGILYIFDKLIEFNIVEKELAGKQLEKLKMINPRLPDDECKTRIALWKTSCLKGNR